MRLKSLEKHLRSFHCHPSVNSPQSGFLGQCPLLDTDPHRHSDKGSIDLKRLCLIRHLRPPSCCLHSFLSTIGLHPSSVLLVKISVALNIVLSRLLACVVVLLKVADCHCFKKTGKKEFTERCEISDTFMPLI